MLAGSWFLDAQTDGCSKVSIATKASFQTGLGDEFSMKLYTGLIRRLKILNSLFLIA